ncbi:MAG TPA: carboxypeptidase regulatory-like domain-containing protein [Terriglobales bacterium]|jgi:hypothetical protein|nr:carboxypeptidase regulatory-like domain-containing protein [Terriglobales bacterium]
MSRRNLVVLLVSFFLCTATLSAQTLTGSITGVVEDPHGAVMPSVEVKLTSDSTGAVRTTTSSQNGEFTFNALPPDTYSLAVEHSGFKKYEKKNLVLVPNDHLSAGQIQLQIGQANESVEVIAEGAAVQTASTERSGVITSEQVSDLTVINRDFSVLASLQPGVVYTPGAEAQSFSGNSQFNVNGSRVGQNNITIDGVPIENSNGTNFNTFISMDAISEVKVQSSGYQAEFGRKAGGAVQAVTKSGGLQYHGEVYWFQRNNIFNALGSVAKTAHQTDPNKPLADPPYRFITAGANFGGPVYIPKLIPRGQKKLFFFVSEEQQRELRPQDVRQVTVPTALERAGNFSQSNNGAPLLIANPFDIKANPTHKCSAATSTSPAVTTGCFANSIIPAALIDPRTQAYLNLLPLPNISGSNFNYQVQESLRIPKHTETLRLDFNPTTNNLFFVTMSRWWDDEQGFAVPAGNANWGWLPSEYNPIARFITLDGQHIFSPTLIFEGRFVASRWTEGNNPKANIVATRSVPGTGIHLPQLDPQNNPLQILPQATFGGVNNPANPAVASRYPITGIENVFIFNPELTKLVGAHTLKTGMYMEYWQEHKGVNGDFTGSYNFSSNSSTYTAALGNTGNPYANALIGDFQNYTENNTRPPLISHYSSLEWFAQDNWKILRNLTIEAGVRLGWSRPFHNAPANEAGFVPERYDRTQQVLLYGMGGAPTPTPAGLNGAEVLGRGNPVNGTVTNGIVPGFAQAFDPNYPPGMRNSDHVKVAPRFGFSYDPWGDGKTAIRGGFGMFYDLRERDNFFTNDFRSLPLQFTPNIEFGLSTAATTLGPLTASGIDFVDPNKINQAIFPSSSFAFQRNRKVPYVMQYNFGIQRELGFKTVVDIAYVASLGRHLIWQTNLNALPVGSGGTGTSQNKLRPYLGYTDINQLEYSGTSNYNSLQVAVNRRFAKSLDFGLAYTWSRAFDFADTEGSGVLNTPFIFPNINFHQWQYGLAGYDRTHIFKASWTYDFPKASKLWDNGFVRGFLDDWRISGITTFQGGAPMGIALDNVCVLKGTALAGSVPVTSSSVCPSSIGSSNSATGWSGSSVGARVIILGKGNVTNVTTPFAHTSGLNGFIFAPPIQNTLEGTQQGTPGFGPRNYFRGPGIDNWDMSLFKQIPMPGERFKLQFRAEIYDVFNHTNWTAVDTNAQFQVDYLGNFAQVNPTFGKYTNAQLKRRMQLALKLAF